MVEFNTCTLFWAIPVAISLSLLIASFAMKNSSAFSRFIAFLLSVVFAGMAYFFFTLSTWGC